jgi:cation-transporting ATPase E
MLSPRPPQYIHNTAHTSVPRQSLPWHRGHLSRVVYTLRVLAREGSAPLNLVNYALGLLLWRIGLVPEALATIGVVTANLILMAVQLGRAQAALVRMQQAFQAPVAVWRIDHLGEVTPSLIQPGDVILLRPGDRVPTEVVVLEESGLLIDMAVQTGESDPVSCRIDARIPPGCTVRSGAAWVLSNAPLPEHQHVSSSERTLIGTQSARLVQIMHGAALCAGVVALLTLSWGVFYGYTWVQLVTASTVVIGLIPNALVLYAAVAHARAAVPLTRQGMIVNHPSVVERMADVDVVCFDKTGTLTTNVLTVASIIPIAIDESHCIDVLGAYAAADGAGNQSSLAIARTFPREPLSALSSVAFDSVRKWSSITTATQTYVLGAPDVLEASLAPEWNHVHDLGGQYPDGRVLLLLAVPHDWFERHAAAIPLGAVVLREQVRTGVQEAIAHLVRHQKRVLVLSGDDPHAVSRVATAAGIVGGQRIHAASLDTNACNLLTSLSDVSVIGRMVPSDKARVVRAFQTNGHRVAFVGDGFNDLDALRSADVAITFGAAHAVVRDSADVVIVDSALTALTHMQYRGELVLQQLRAIGLHVVTRVSMCAVVWVGCLLCWLPTWTPFDSTAIALLGVAAPAILIVAVPHFGSLDVPIWSRMRVATGIGLLLVLGWWVAVTAFGVTDVRWLTGAVIATLWVLVVQRVVRRRLVVR